MAIADTCSTACSSRDGENTHSAAFARSLDHLRRENPTVHRPLATRNYASERTQHDFALLGILEAKQEAKCIRELVGNHLDHSSRLDHRQADCRGRVMVTLRNWSTCVWQDKAIIDIDQMHANGHTQPWNYFRCTVCIGHDQPSEGSQLPLELTGRVAIGASR